MDKLAHKQAEIGAKTTQEQMAVEAKQPQEQAPPEKTFAPKLRTTWAKKKMRDTARGPVKPKRAWPPDQPLRWRRGSSDRRGNPIMSPSLKIREPRANPRDLHLERV